jgi:MscS family membrane protein
MNWRDSVRQISDFVADHLPVLVGLQILGLVLLALLTRAVAHAVLRRLRTDAEHRSRYFAYFCQALGRPLGWAVWMVAALFGVRSLGMLIPGRLDAFDPVLIKILQCAIVSLITWGALRFFNLCKQDFMQRNHRSDGGYDDFSQAQTLEKICQIAVIGVAGLTIMAIFKIPMSGILTVGGVGGAALAFANQQLIANIFSGFAIFLDRPFSVGDWIYTTDTKIQGTVTNIGLRLTTIMGFDKRPIYVPNSTFNTSAMVNASRMTNRRILQYIGLRYADLNRVEVIFEKIREMLRKHPGIDQDQLTLVNVVDGATDMGSAVGGFYGSSSINFMVYTFTKTTNWARFQKVQDDVMLAIGRIIRAEGGDIAFTSYSLFVESVPEALIKAIPTSNPQPSSPPEDSNPGSEK